MKYEEAYDKLLKIKEQLESPEITLDESLKLYQDSVEYTRVCLEKLKEADGKIVVIKSEVDRLIEKPLETVEG